MVGREVCGREDALMGGEGGRVLLQNDEGVDRAVKGRGTSDGGGTCVDCFLKVIGLIEGLGLVS